MAPSKLPSRYEVERVIAKDFPSVDAETMASALVVYRVALELTEALDAHFVRHGITRGRFIVLLLLFRGRTTGLSPAVLAERSAVTRATMSGLVDTLEKDGFVRRADDPNDGRGVIVHLTRNGERFLRKMLPDHFQRTAALLEVLTKAERHQLAELLGRVHEALPALRDKDHEAAYVPPKPRRARRRRPPAGAAASKPAGAAASKSAGAASK